MWATIIQGVLSFIGGPVVNGAIKAYQAKLAAGNTSERIEADLAARELLVQQREIEVEGEYKKALLGRWFEPTNLFGYILVLYIGKVFIWDAALHLGSTDAVHGDVGSWAGMIMVFFVGKRGIENVTRILTKK